MNILNLKKYNFLYAIYAVIIFSLVLAACGSPADINTKPASGVVTPPVTPPPGNPDAPVITISAAAAFVAYNTSTTITWSSTKSTSCSSSPSGLTGVSGTYTTPKLTSTTTYILTCTGTGGSSIGSVKIAVTPSAITHFTDAVSGNVTVTSANVLTNGAVITISGTTHYNATYTATNVNATSFSIVATFSGDDATGSWQMAGGMISGCSDTMITGTSGALKLSNVPSRFNGVAPLSVFFDALGTTATTTTNPFHDLDYRWNFGDSAGSPVGGQYWVTGSSPNVSSRNLAIGPEAAHVYEVPGIYTIALTATDGTNKVSNSCAQIVVQDPDVVFAGTKTICFSTSGTFESGTTGGCPTGATTVTTSNFASAINTYKAPNRRLLFRRGETFAAASSAILNVTGPGIVGAFGAGTSLPVAKISAGGSFPIIQVSSSSTPGIADWRVMDFDFDGSSIQNTDITAIGASGGFNQFTAIRLNIHDIYRGVAAGLSLLDWWNNHSQPGHAAPEEWSITDSLITGLPGCNSPGNYNCDWRIYLAGKKQNIQGNYLDNQNTGGSHVIRSEYMAKGVIANNTLTRAGDFQLAVKLHAAGWAIPGVGNPGGVGTYSEYVIIADNKIMGGINPWTFDLGPQDEISDERVKDVIVERNWFTAGTATQIQMRISSSETTIRNNICDLTGAAYHTCVAVTQWGITPAPNNVRVYNNTIYSGSSGDYAGVSIGTATNTVVRNNLASAPLASGPVMISGTGTGLVQSNNLLNNSPSALFVNASPTLPAHFGLKALPNPARDTGLSTVPVLTDFFGITRPQNGVIDIGAVEGL